MNEALGREDMFEPFTEEHCSPDDDFRCEKAPISGVECTRKTLENCNVIDCKRTQLRVVACLARGLRGQLWPRSTCAKIARLSSWTEELLIGAAAGQPGAQEPGGFFGSPAAMRPDQAHSKMLRVWDYRSAQQSPPTARRPMTRPRRSRRTRTRDPRRGRRSMAGASVPRSCAAEHPVNCPSCGFVNKEGRAFLWRLRQSHKRSARRVAGRLPAPA